MPETGADYHPRAGEVVDASEMSEHLSEGYPFQDRYVSGLNLTWTGLTAHIAIGAANIGGKYVSIGAQVNEGPLATGATNYIFLNSTADIRFDPSATPAADEILLWAATTNGSTVTGTTDYRDPALVVAEDLDVTGDLTVDGVANASSFSASATQPYIEVIDESGGGDSFRVWNRNGKLQLTDPSGAIIYVEDLSKLAFGYQQPVLDVATAPAGGETGGERYIVLPTGTGAFSGQDNDIAEYNGATWDFTTPDEGWIAYAEDDNELYFFSGSAWAKFGTDAATANTLVRRNSAGRASFAEPSVAGQALVAGGLPFLHSAQTAGAFTAAVNTSYNVDHATPATVTPVTLPATFDQGDWVIIAGGANTAGFTVAPNTGDTIQSDGDVITDAGTLDFADPYKTVIFIADTASATWIAFASGGAGGLSWNEETGTSITVLEGNAYFTTNAGLASGATPVGVFGDEFLVKGELAKGGWKVTAATGTRLVIDGDGAGFGSTPTTADYAITVADDTNDHFTVATDISAELYVGQTFTATGTNAGTYTIASVVVVAGPNTEIYVDEDITSATADGNVEIVGSIQSVEDVASAHFVYSGGNDWYCEPRVGNVKVN